MSLVRSSPVQPDRHHHHRHHYCRNMAGDCHWHWLRWHGAITTQGAIDNISKLSHYGRPAVLQRTNSNQTPKSSNTQCLTSNATTILWGSLAVAGGGWRCDRSPDRPTMVVPPSPTADAKDIVNHPCQHLHDSKLAVESRYWQYLRTTR